MLAPETSQIDADSLDKQATAISVFRPTTNFRQELELK